MTGAMRSPTRLAPILAALLGAGCASTPHLRFAPAVQETELRGDTGALEGRIAVAWRGVVEREGAPELRFRLRLENPGDTPFTLVPAAFELLDGALTSIAGERVDDLPVALEPGGSSVFELAFPVPTRAALEALDLSSLTLRTSFQGGRWSWSTSFQRVRRDPYDPYDPYWGSPWRVHFGFGWIHR
jgi:hypothetical protein